MAEFDSDLNIGYHTNVQDVQTSLVSDVAGGVVASVVDAGASIWNSLPFTPEVDTADLLSGISDNALRVYQEHPDVIHTASFIGSSFVPGGLAIKGMNAMRSGSKAVSWFSKLGKEADIAKATELLKLGAEGTKDYRALVRGMYAKTAVNQAIDAAAAEVAILATLNASPLVEDYMKDPVTNFGISVAFGGVLGGAMGTIADHYALRQIAGGVVGGALDSTVGKLKPILPDMPNAIALQVAGVNSDFLGEIITKGKLAGKTTENDINVSYATKFQLLAQKEADDIFHKIVSPEIAALPIEQKEAIKKMIMASPEMFGVESIAAAKASDLEVSSIMRAPKAGLTAEPVLKTVSSTTGPTQEKARKAVFFQDLGLYGTMADLKHFGGASTAYANIDEITKPLAKNFGRIPDHDTALGLQTKSAPHAQGDYLAAMKLVDDMSLEEFKRLKIAPTDSALLAAVHQKMAKDMDFYEAGTHFADTNAYARAIVKEKLPVPDNYKFASASNIHAYDVTADSSISYEARDMVAQWRRGSVHDLRLGAEEFKRAGFSAHRTTQTKEAAALEANFKLVYESARSTALRGEFQKVADKEGYVYLWRGSRSLKDRAGVRSYTTLNDKATEFGTPRLYQVHVDDIVAGISDPGKGGAKTEILVMEGERRPATLSQGGKEKLAFVVTPDSKKVGLDDIASQIFDNKKAEMDMLLAEGIPMESIAIKTNTHLDLVRQYALTDDKSVDMLRYLANEHLAKGGNSYGNIINSVDDIAKTLDQSKQPLILSGNIRKSTYSAAASGLDARTLTNINAELTAATMYGSKNEAISQLADRFFAPGSEEGSFRYVLDMIKSHLGKGNNQLSGNAFVNSFDFYSRNMADLGPMISYIGKDVGKIANNYIQKINKPIADSMSAVSANVADTIEFNTFHEVNASLAGWRQFKDGKIWQKVERSGADGKPVTVLEAVKYQGKEYTVVTPSAIKAIETIQGQSGELLSLINTNRKILGQAPVNDIGLWVPSFSPVNKFIAYVHDAGTDSTQLLWANTKQEYTQLVRDYKSKLTANGQDKTIRVIEKGVDQQEWSRLNGRLDTMQMKVADSSQKKSGSSASALVRADNQVFSEIAQGYEHFINSQLRTTADLAMHDITSQLDKMSAFNRGMTDAQPLSMVKKFIEGDKDTAKVLKNTLLGEPNLGEYDGWKSVNQSFETGLAFASSTVNKVWDATVKPLTRTFLGGKKELEAHHLATVNYEQIAKELEAKGIVNPWANFDNEAASMFGLSKLSDSPDTSKRIIFASNALAATVALRVGELAQPLVNIMSLPILTALAAGTKMPATFMGAIKGTAKVSGTQIMYEGARAANSPQWAHFDAVWRDLGYFDGMVSEANKTLQAARSMNKGAIATTEKLLDSRMVEIMSKPADWSEAFTRRQTMFTGAVLAKRLYPELTDEGVTIFARDFMDKAVGNFHASQRPVFFQGTLGVALGLFQTYSLTLGQSIYRQLELKNYKLLGKAALTQSGIFGIGSLPGFQAVSQAIGDNFSDDNIDLTTGTYRALPDTMAETVLYGLPSLAGIGTHTRGDTSFRFPGLSGDNVVALNFAKQMTEAVGSVAGAMGEGNGAGQALLQALSLQNMSRPLARGAELATGYSVTRQGNTVQVPEEVWTTVGVASRILGTRPLEETKLRDGMHLNTFYGAADRDARNKVMSDLKTGIRGGTLDEAAVGKAYLEYQRKDGTPAGWRSAVATALAKTETSGREVFVDKLKPDNPLNYMLNGLDGY